MRYHINPSTGEPGKCQAKPTCPLGDLEKEHYSSLAAARKASEAAHREAALASLKQPREAVLLSSSQAVSVGEGLAGESLRELYPGRGAVVQQEALAKVQAPAEELVTLLSPAGRFTLPENPGWALAAVEAKGGDSQAVMDDYFPPRNGFRMLNSGAETIAYLHEPLQMVYKLHHNESYALGLDGRATEARSRFAVLLHEARYLRLQEEREALAAVGVEYAPTYFLRARDGQGEEVRLVAQPYMDSEIYTPLDLGDLRVETPAGPSNYSRYLGRFGLTDLHAGNVFYNNHTGQMVLFDCLFMAEDAFEDEVRRACLEDSLES